MIFVESAAILMIASGVAFAKAMPGDNGTRCACTIYGGWDYPYGGDGGDRPAGMDGRDGLYGKAGNDGLWDGAENSTG